MKTVLSLVERGLLTARHAATAQRFARDPETFRLGPTLHGIALDLICGDRGIEAVEKARGWPARSAKAILRVLLDAMEEKTVATLRPKHDARRSAQDDLDFLTGQTVEDHVPLMCAYGLSRIEARLLLIMMNCRAKVAGKEYILAALYPEAAGDTPDAKVLWVFIHKLRRKLQGSGMRIETVWGEGWILHRLPAALQALNESAAS